MSPFRPAGSRHSAYLTHFHAGHASGVAVLAWERRGDEMREVRVFRSRDGFSPESADPTGDASQALVYDGSEECVRVVDDRVTEDGVFYYTVFVKDDGGGWHREIRTTVTIDGEVHWRRAGVESEGESRDCFRQMWTDADTLR
jgi:hypothetical protein